jgi:hypothetical protein
MRRKLLTNTENGDIMYSKSGEKKSQIEFKHLKIINDILAAGERVEIVPAKDGVKIFKVVRRESKS